VIGAPLWWRLTEMPRRCLLPWRVRVRIVARHQCRAQDGTGWCCQRWVHADDWHIDARNREWRTGFERKPEPGLPGIGGHPCSNCCHGWMSMPERLKPRDRITANHVCVTCGGRNGSHYWREDTCPPHYLPEGAQ
jgi:hypothetical protein